MIETQMHLNISFQKVLVYYAVPLSLGLVKAGPRQVSAAK